MSSKKLRIIMIVFIVAVLGYLNIQKYRELNEVVVPVWSSYDEDYYYGQNNNLFDKIKNTLSPGRLIYGVTRVRLQAPITYLKREIPLLAYFTPKELKSPTETIYTPDKDKIIQLKFNIRDHEKIAIINEQKNIPENNNILASKLPEAAVSSPKTASVSNKTIEIPVKRKYNSAKRPLIAIYHSHTSETYLDDPRYQDGNGHVLPGNIGNVGKAGIELARVLSEKYGFRVIHTTKIHDQRYNRSYYNSRKTVKQFLRDNPDLDLILDIHRDGIRANLSRDAITTVINQKRVANVMIIVANGVYPYGEKDRNSSNWQDNLRLAKSLAAKMDQLYPGLLRRVEVRNTTTNRYNQDLSPRALLIEIGDYHNTTQEAVRAARLVADAIAALF